MECKFIIFAVSMGDLGRINRYIMECKSKTAEFTTKKAAQN